MNAGVDATMAPNPIRFGQHARRTALLGAAMLLWAGSVPAQGNSGPAPALPVSVVEVTPTTLPNTFEITAQAEGAREAEVRARVGGILLKRLYDEGARVKEGQPLFQIDPEPYRNALEEAAAKARQTARETARLKPLFNKQAVSMKEYEDSVSVNEIAQANLKTAQLNLKWTTVTATMDGVSGRAQRSEGNLITTASDGSLLTSIYQVNPIWVRFGLSESDTARLPGGRLDPKQETSVEILMPGGGFYPHKGRINFLSVYIDPKLGTQQLRAEFSNPDSHFMPGQFLRVRVTTGQQENVFLVPQAAVIQTEKGFIVWTVGEGDKVVPTPIRTGNWIDRNWVVLSGLKPNDRVVVDNLIKIRPGAVVAPKVVPLDTTPLVPVTQSGDKGGK